MAIPLALVVLDCSGQTLIVNPAAEQLLGIDASSLVGHPGQRILERLADLSDNPAEAMQNLQVALQSAVHHSVELDIAGAADPPAALHTRVFPAGEGEGEQRSTVLTFEWRSTAQPESQALTSEVVAALSHGLKSPLASIKAATLSLHASSKRWDPPGHQDLVRVISREADALHDAIQGLVDLIELRTSRAALQFTAVELGDLMMTILPRWKALAPRHLFELALPGEVPTITADAKRAEQALNILLEFAVAYSPNGGTIRVNIRPREGEIVVTIRHYGHTVAPELHKHLFEPFFRLPDLPEATVLGGIGPALAQAILETHGGGIRVEAPQTSGGMLLHATWPLVPPRVASHVSDLEVAQVSAVSNASRQQVVPPRPREVVLVLDSDPRMQRYLRANLEAQKYRALVASDLADARRLIDLEEPDLIILDIGAAEPGIAETLQSLRDYAGAPIVVLAHRHDPDECASVLDRGAADYVVKPFSIEELLARVRLALRRHRATTVVAPRDAVYHNGALKVDFTQRLVTLEGAPISLSRTEYKLLRVLVQHAGMVLSHEVLLDRVWGAGYSHEVEFVWVYIRRLRRKLEPDPSKPRYILTVPGVGYRIARGD